jgi:hypothetical protein
VAARAGDAGISAIGIAINTTIMTLRSCNWFVVQVHLFITKTSREWLVSRHPRHVRHQLSACDPWSCCVRIVAAGAAFTIDLVRR